MGCPDPERQVQFLFNVQRLLSDGSFVATYKFALLIALTSLAVDSHDETTESVPLSTRDIAEKFVEVYWRQVLPWVHPQSGRSGVLRQATGTQAKIVSLVAAAHEDVQGSWVRLFRDKKRYHRLLRGVADVIQDQPLWKLQRIGPDVVEFLYENKGTGDVVVLHADVVFCLRRFRDLITYLAEAAWVRFVMRRPENQTLLGEGPDLREFLFGSDRSTVAKVRDVLREVDGNRCFYCGGAIRGEPAVDHFVPWSRYLLELGHNYVLADARCNGFKSDRLAAFDHLDRWCARNARGDWTAALDRNLLPHDIRRTERVAGWAYAQTERAKATVWQEGREGLVRLDPGWRQALGWIS